MFVPRLSRLHRLVVGLLFGFLLSWLAQAAPNLLADVNQKHFADDGIYGQIVIGQ